MNDTWKIVECNKCNTIMHVNSIEMLMKREKGGKEIGNKAAMARIATAIVFGY